MASFSFFDFQQSLTEIQNFVFNVIDDDTKRYLLTQGSFSNVYKYENKIYIVPRREQSDEEIKRIQTIYDKLKTLDDKYKKYILLPTEVEVITADSKLVLQFDVCQGDLFMGANDSLSKKALERIRSNKDYYQTQMNDIVETVSQIHTLGIRTLDIKPANMLFCDKIIKLTDFGGSSLFENGKWAEGAFTKEYLCTDKRLDEYGLDFCALEKSFTEVLGSKYSFAYPGKPELKPKKVRRKSLTVSMKRMPSIKF